MPKTAKGVKDEVIAKVGTHVCEYADNNKTDRAKAITSLSKEMTANGIRPNDVAVIKIMRLAVKDICSGQQDNLDKLL
jgi:hypothetical protein